MSDEHRGPSYQVVAYWLLITFFLVIYLVAWYGDPAKTALAQTFLGIWVAASIIMWPTYMIAKRTPLARFPQNMNMAKAFGLGLLEALMMIGVSVFFTKLENRMAVVDLPVIVNSISGLFSTLFKSIPKVRLLPLQFSSLYAGFEAVGWQVVVAGVEEGMKLSMTVSMAVVLWHWYRSSKGEKPKRAVVFGMIAVAALTVGLFWDILHGFQSYSLLSEYASAFVGMMIMSVFTFATGNPFPAFWAHFWYNVLVPAVALVILLVP